MKISYFGDTYSHTYAAAVAMLGESGFCARSAAGCDSVYKALEKVKLGEAEAAVVPIENSYEGTVTATEDALGDLGLFAVRETVLAIKQNLIADDGVKLSDVKTVYSHPQGLAQCAVNLRKLLPNAATVAVAYTSAGLDMLCPNSAAIARTPKSGQRIIAENISDRQNNCTRFLLVKSMAETAGNKVSITFDTENRPGALLEVLAELGAHNMNMAKIESRPAKTKMGQYVFYADFDFSGGESELRDFLALLGRKCTRLQYLGRYEKYKP